MSINTEMEIPVEISARHAHLSREHITALFGSGNELKALKELSQPGQAASTECIDLIGPRHSIEGVRVLLPPRDRTQIEISRSDQFRLGIEVPFRNSGDLDGSPGLLIRSAYGNELEIKEGLICAVRHLHMKPADAGRAGLEDNWVVRVKVAGQRELIYGDVLVRVKDSYGLALHLDTDEANAAGLAQGSIVFLDSIQNKEGII